MNEKNSTGSAILFKGNLFFANVGRFIEETENALQEDTKYLIVDASGINSIDSTAAAELGTLYNKLKKKGIRFFLVEHIAQVNEELRTYGVGFIIENGGVRQTITDALAAVGYNRQYPLGENYEIKSVEI